MHYMRASKIGEEVLLSNTKLLLLTAIAFLVIALQFSQIARIARYFTIGYFPVLSLAAGGISLKKNRNIMFIVICAYLIIYFIFVQIIRPEWSGITPYYFG